MNEINVAHIHTIDQSGGGAKIVRKLHKKLNQDDLFSSHLYVGEKKTNLDSITELPVVRFEEEFNRFVEQILSFEGLAAPSSFRYPKIIQQKDIDILHIHNIHGGFFNFLNLNRFANDLAVFWTFHDMWPITGRCVHAYDCEKYKETCQNCPYLDTPRRVAFDSTSLLHKMKKRLISDLNPNVITPSNWMKTKVEESDTDVREIKHIPHGVDTDLFSPKKREQCRRRFGIAPDSTVILFVSSSLSNPVKGMQYLIAALNQIESENISLLAIGDNELPENELPTNFDLYTPGYIKNNDLPAVYTAADVTIIPSLYESFGLVATESMACETPVVAYKTSGLQEQITNSTGWLADYKDVRSVSEKIQEAIKNKKQCRRKGKRARKRVLNKYTQNRFVGDHKQIYKETLN